ncbi:MAG TPA: peptidyl-prolyl cis-trans isomerase [Opitutaceae bacterium]
MISWIQRTFQHHFKIIFGTILTVTVLSFVFTIGSTPGIGRSEHKEVNQVFFGHNMASAEEKARIGEDARLSATLRYGGEVSADQMQFYAFQRVAALHLADQMHIPQTGDDEMKQFILGLRYFQGSDGHFDESRYDALRNSVKGGGAVSEADITRVIKDDVRANKIELYLGGPGYVMPRDVTQILLKGDTTWTVMTASVDYSAYDPGITLSEADIAKFFSSNAFRYTIAPRVSVDYINFPATDFTSQVTLTDAEVREFYNANPRRFPKAAPDKAAAAKAEPSADFAAAEPRVRAELQLETAKKAAAKAASDLAYALYEGKVSNGASLDSFLAERKLKASSLAPFTLEAGPSELQGSHEVAAAAFDLDASRFYSEGIPTSDGAVVLLWKASLPSREPLLAEVRERVVADARDNEKRTRFIAFGQAVKASIEGRLKAGEPFDKAVAEAAGPVKMNLKTFGPFTLRTPPEGMDPSITAALDHLEKGGVSDMQATAEKGFFVYAADKKVPTLDPSNPRLMQVWGQLALNYSRSDTLGILGDVVDREVKRMDSLAK